MRKFIVVLVAFVLLASGCDTNAPVDDTTPIEASKPQPALQPPTQSDTDCDPNYSGCVPIASDVDCASGSGNGPAYTGQTTVIGIDIYDLDRDGDGIACE